MKKKVKNLFDIVMVVLMFPFVLMGIMVAYTFATIEYVVELVFKERKTNDLQNSKSKD